MLGEYRNLLRERWQPQNISIQNGGKFCIRLIIRDSSKIECCLPLDYSSKVYKRYIHTYMRRLE